MKALQALLLALTVLAAPCWAGEQHGMIWTDINGKDWTVLPDTALSIGPATRLAPGLVRADSLIARINSLTLAVSRLERRLKVIEWWGGRYLDKRGPFPDTMDVAPVKVSGDASLFSEYAVLLARKTILKWRMQGAVKMDLWCMPLRMFETSKAPGIPIDLKDRRAEDLLAEYLLTEAIETGRMKAEGDGR